MRSWYFDLKEFKPKVGFEFEFTVEHNGKTYRHLCRVTEAIPEKKIAYTWRYDRYEGDSMVTFQLFPEGDKTRLKLTHEGLETFPKAPDFERKSFEGGWTALTSELQKFLEGDESGRGIEDPYGGTREDYARTYEHIRAHGAKALDPCMALWHTTADTYADEDTEAIVPVDRALPDGDGVKVYELAGATVASAVHHGNFAGFTKLHPALLRWIEANGYRITGPSREIYIRNNDKQAEDSVTEVQYPVEKE